MLSYRERVEGCLFGLAIGDATGRHTEFLSHAKIVEQFGPMGPEGPGEPALVTDDTEMALAVGEAIVKARGEGASDVGEFAPHLVAAFIEWVNGTNESRAPGRTCMAACKSLAGGKDWRIATGIHGKGCGANMRVQPVGLLTDRHGFHSKKRAQLAQLQAAITHGHPTALAASDATSHAIHALAVGAEPGELVTRLQDYVATQRQVYHEVLGDLWQRAGDSGESAYISRGWQDVETALKKLATALENPKPDEDPCIATGDGRTAEEALATALHAFLLYPDNVVRVIRRAANTRGDSDSIACIAGALAGAHQGVEAWPKEWRKGIEFANRLQTLADSLSA